MRQCSRVDQICLNYGYPEEFRTLLERIVKAITVPETLSIVLLGSASRGEIVGQLGPRGLMLFSDLEIMVITRHQSEARTRQKALSDIESLEVEQRAIGACTFHIDVGYDTQRSWKRPHSEFHAWEIKQTGYVVFGEDVLDLIQVQVQPQSAIQSSLNRLWHLLLYFPASLLRRQSTQHDEQVFSYILSRAILDFPLWLLVSNKVLVPGFTKRYDFLQAEREFFRQQDFPVDELIDWVKLALEIRNAPTSELLKERITPVYEAVLGWYSKMVLWTTKSRMISDDLPILLQQYRKQLYSPLGWKRRLWEARLAVEFAKTRRLRQGAHWLFENKQLLITSFLWHMHQAAISYLNDDAPAATKWLALAASNMEELWPRDYKRRNADSFVDSWLALRNRFFDFIPQFYRGLESKQSYYRWILSDGYNSI
ncbi:MAG TPA: hypothetical protein PKH77_05990 [Anaerolineae bacterium]|nr:hypothetical protein [Anaerolineae bacterium]